MSRTRKGTKPPGFEYWSRRPNSGCVPGRKDKQMTHQIERARAKLECKDADFKDYEERLTEEEYIDRKKREE